MLLQTMVQQFQACMRTVLQCMHMQTRQCRHVAAAKRARTSLTWASSIRSTFCSASTLACVIASVGSTMNAMLLTAAAASGRNPFSRIHTSKSSGACIVAGRSASWACLRCRVCAHASQVSESCQTAVSEAHEMKTSTELRPVQRITATSLSCHNGVRSSAFAGIQQRSSQGGRKHPPQLVLGRRMAARQTDACPPTWWSVPCKRRQIETVSHAGRISVGCAAVFAHVHPVRWLQGPRQPHVQRETAA